MLGRFSASIAGFSALSLPLTLAAQDAAPAPQDVFIMNAWSDPDECNFENAKRVLFADLVADADSFSEDCVAVEGYWRERALFSSQKHAKIRRSSTSKRLRGKRIGLYAQWELVGDPPQRPKRSIFVGRVGQCETQWPEAMMVMGYCHYTGGPILLVSQVQSA